MVYHHSWGVIFDGVDSIANLGNETYSDLTFNHDVYFVDDREEGQGGNAISPGESGQGIAFGADEAPQLIVEMGVFRGATARIADPDAPDGVRVVEGDIYAFRLEDGRVVARIDDVAMDFINYEGYEPGDILGVDLTGDYEPLETIDPTDFNVRFDNICFVTGTLIETADGLVAVEDLRPGMLLRTADHGFQPLLLALRSRVDAPRMARHEKLRPVRIVAGALGNGLPRRDLRVSRQHRMLVDSPVAKRMFGTSEVLVPAVRLTALPGIFVEEAPETLEYFHLVMDEHQILFAEGAASESLLIGPQALAAMSSDAREEILTLFPDAVAHCNDRVPARIVPSGARQKSLIARHAKNGKPMLGA